MHQAKFAAERMAGITVESLIVKFLLNNGASTGGAVAKALCLPNTSIIEVLAQLKQQQIVVYVLRRQLGLYLRDLERLELEHDQGPGQLFRP